jgi:hypothetical protein
MKALVAAGLVALSLTRAGGAQTETIDVATFTPPQGWARSTYPNGVIVYQAPPPRSGPPGFCQIFVYPVGASTGTPDENFNLGWRALVTTAPWTTGLPRTSTRQTPDGWTIVTGSANSVNGRVAFMTVLYAATGHGRVVSALVNVASPAYQAEADRFLASIRLAVPAGIAAAPAAPAAPPAANAPAPAAPATAPAASLPIPAGGLAPGYVYALPDGWRGTAFAQGISYLSPPKSNGEQCQITVFQLRPAGASLPDDARAAFRGIFNADPFQNASYPYPAPTLTRGTSPLGWDYFVIAKTLGGREGDDGLWGARVMAVRLDRQLAVIATTAKRPLVSACFGQVLGDDWPGFFHSLQFRSVAAPSDKALAQRLAGTWNTTTASVADRYTFSAEGRYANAAAVGYTSRISSTEVLMTTHGFAGDGAFTVRGNTITLAADNKGPPTVRRFRLEQVSDDLGQTWSDRLCLWAAGAGEVCYARER